MARFRSFSSKMVIPLDKTYPCNVKIKEVLFYTAIVLKENANTIGNFWINSSCDFSKNKKPLKASELQQ